MPFSSVRKEECDQNVQHKTFILPEDQLLDIFKGNIKFCAINHYILVTMVTKRTRWLPLLFVKIILWYSKGVKEPN